MATSKKKINVRAFTIIELLVVIAIIVLLVSILIPALGKAFQVAKSTEDRTKVKGIYAAMTLYSSSNNGKLPRPSFIKDNFEPNLSDDTTGNLMSVMIARNFFNSDYVISPVESNPNVKDIQEIGLGYDYGSIDGEEVFWDSQFNGDVENASAANPANNSYAHQALVGERVNLKWNSSAGISDIIISNRGPRDGAFGDETESNSYTLLFHGSKSSWSGSIVTGDGSARIAKSMFPEGIAYQPINGMPLGPDNIFDAEVEGFANYQGTSACSLQASTNTPWMPRGDWRFPPRFAVGWILLCMGGQSRL